MDDDPKDPRNRAERIRALFNRARASQQQEQAPANEQEHGRGSQMVRDAAPAPHLRPKGPDRDAVDAEIHNERLAAEREKTIRQEHERAREKAKEQERTRDKDRGDRER